ncbi:sulfatase-like hydrolase/transferase [Streptomyces sp. NPDC048603]|uniref:sulfatase-like hydrolase/transferase n=1 Tax=Streptomyces sp. NPDC048603 TaxID=3365577 RepID=UPI003711C672
MPSRRHFLAGSAAAAGLAALPALAGTTPARAAESGTGAAAPGPPNLVVVLADDLGYGDLGAYGQKLIATPRLDRLAAEGLRFTDAYSAAAVCAPSRASLLTGLHTGHSAVRANPGSGGQGSLRAGDTTFAEVLRARGYRTGLFGKWGFGPEAADQESHPNSRGFEEFYGYIDHSHAHQYYPSRLWHNGAEEAVATGSYAPDLIVSKALGFLDEHAGGADPFLLVVAPTLPHAPSDVPDTGAYASRSWTSQNKGHAAQITRLDQHVGTIVDRLAALGVAGSTVVLFASDNGPHEEGGVNPDLFDANGPLRGYKRNLYEGGVRVPLLAWAPGRIAPGTTSSRPTPLYDLLPTLADLAGAPAPADIDGLSAVPVLDGRADLAPYHSHLYWYRDEQGVTSRANAQDGGRAKQIAEAVRKEDWKAVRFAPARDRTAPDAQWAFELYDLAADPGETRDVAAAHPALVTSLTALLQASWADTYARRPWGLTTTADPAAGTVTTTLANGTARPWTDARVTLRAPAGWTVTATGPATAASLAPGAALTTTWRITPPPTALPGTTHPLTADAATSAYAFTAARPWTVLPPAPARDSWLSDLPWVSAANGWGPVELDRSNGRKPAGDGTAISFGGRTYAKGLGVHAPSEIVYHLGVRADRFTALVGIDDFSTAQSAAGATRARVVGDGRTLFTSGVLTGAGGPARVDLDVRGVRLLHLVVEDAGGNTAFDHTSWAEPWLIVLRA